MTETNPKQDTTTNDSEENTKQQQPDLAERQPRLERVTEGKTQSLRRMATYKSLKCSFYVCM